MKPSLNAKKQMRKKLVRAPTVHGPDVLKESYDPKLTMKQNYAKLGLLSSLDVRPDTGGVERRSDSTARATDASASGSTTAQTNTLRRGMARILRDEAGNIVDIVEASTSDDEDRSNAQGSSSSSESTPWGKLMKASVADRDGVETFMPPSGAVRTRGGGDGAVVQQLEQLAAQAAPVERHTSQLEMQWLADLVAKHGHDIEAMVHDKRLNPWQKTQGEIKRAIKKAGGFEAFSSST